MSPNALDQYLIEATMFLPTPNLITESLSLKELLSIIKSYAFFSQSSLHANDSWPEKVYFFEFLMGILKFQKCN